MSELLQILAQGGPPAFATDGAGHITFWNAAAARLFGREADEVLGQHCYDVVQGRDSFGNRYCNPLCPVQATMRRGEPVSGCELVLDGRGAGRFTMAVTLLKVPGSRRDQYSLVHLFRDDEDVVHARADSEAARAPAPPLTHREREILAWVATGLQNKEVAQRLAISPATVRNHVHNILEKLAVHSKLEAVSLAFRRGWVGADGLKAHEGRDVAAGRA